MFTRKRLIVGLVCAPLVIIVCLVGVKFKEVDDLNQRSRERVRQLRDQYPFESLESRLPTAPRFLREQTISKETGEQTREFENSIEQEIESWGREAILQKLHEGSVEEFVNREGFGVWRMFGAYSQSIFVNGYQKENGNWVGRNKTSIPQPSGVFSHSSKEIDLTAQGTPADSSNIFALHYRNMLHFAHPKGFGVMKDRRHVAGFQAHQFNELIEEKPWKIMRLELVGLLLEDQPRVYVTAALPRMQDIRDVPTRSPDAFETAGLEKLRGGEELFIRDMADGVRMLGAIRSAQQCIKCHGGERGALLGALSYGLQREP